MRVELELPDETATLALGALLAERIPHRGAVLLRLRGDLGAGKTTLVRGWLRGRGFGGAVKSPTYTLVEPYVLDDGSELMHFDLYRLGDEDELEAIGFRDYLASGALCIVEWPERAGELLAGADLEITLVPDGTGRRVGLVALSERARPWLAGLGADRAPDVAGASRADPVR